MRHLAAAFIVVSSFLFCGSALADNLVFNLTLTPTAGVTTLGSGYGSIVLTPSPQQAAENAAGLVTVYSPNGGGLDSFSITMGGLLVGAQRDYVSLLNGQIVDLAYHSVSLHNLNGYGLVFSLSLTPTTFDYMFEQGLLTSPTPEETGTVSIAAATAPEPGAFVLVATGLLAAPAAGRRRFIASA